MRLGLFIVGLLAVVGNAQVSAKAQTATNCPPGDFAPRCTGTPNEGHDITQEKPLHALDVDSEHRSGHARAADHSGHTETAGHVEGGHFHGGHGHGGGGGGGGGGGNGGGGH
jgi:hypothetical protein